MRFQKIGLTTVVLCTVGIQQSFSIDIVTKEKPNIVFILADDLGWTDLGVMGSDYYETPNIDRFGSYWNGLYAMLCRFRYQFTFPLCLDDGKEYGKYNYTR